MFFFITLLIEYALTYQPLQSKHQVVGKITIFIKGTCWPQIFTRSPSLPNKCPPEMEKSGPLCYYKCRENYHAFGPICIRNKHESTKIKRFYNRGAPHIPVCEDNKVQQGGLCYPPCPENFRSGGPTCWGKCAENYVACGAGCALTKDLCKGIILLTIDTLFDQLQAPTQVFKPQIDFLACCEYYISNCYDEQSGD